MSLWLYVSLFVFLSLSLPPPPLSLTPSPFFFLSLSYSLSVLQSLHDSKKFSLSLSLSLSQIFISPSSPFRYYVIFLEFETFFNPQQPAWIKAFSTKLTIDLERKYLPLQDTPMWDVFIKHFGKKKTGKLKVE